MPAHIEPARQPTIDELLDEVVERVTMFRTGTTSPDRARGASVAITHLETAKLWIAHAFAGMENDHGQK